MPLGAALPRLSGQSQTPDSTAPSIAAAGDEHHMPFHFINEVRSLVETAAVQLHLGEALEQGLI